MGQGVRARVRKKGGKTTKLQHTTVKEKRRTDGKEEDTRRRGQLYACISSVTVICADDISVLVISHCYNSHPYFPCQSMLMYMSQSSQALCCYMPYANLRNRKQHESLKAHASGTLQRPYRWHIVFPGAVSQNPKQTLADTMVAVSEGNQIVVAAAQASQQDCHVVGFAT